MKAIDELNLYINEPEISGALLLTGQWGCGKTYLVDQFKKKADKDKYALIVISLFGIDSLSMLTDRIKEQVALATFPFNSEVRKRIKQNKILLQGQKFLSFFWSGLKQRAKAAEHLSSVMAFLPIEKEIGVGKKKRKLILIFDDLERSAIPKKELLGAINEYVETKKIKTILIAAEEKIDDGDYGEFKEKVISRTIKLTPDYSSIIHEIIYSFSVEAEYKAFLERQESLIVRLFTESKSENLRTLRSLLIDFDRVFACLKKTHFDETLIRDIFCSFGVMLFEHKAGNYKAGTNYIKDDLEAKQKYSFDISRYRLITLQGWITEGRWDEAATCNEYRQRFCQKDMSSIDKFFFFGFYDLNDSIVREGFPPALELAYNGELPCKMLITLINKIALARKWSISLPQEVDYDKIAEGIRLRIERIKNNEVVEPEYHTYITADEQAILNERETQLYNLASSISGDLLSYWQNRRIFIDCMTNGDEILIRQLKNYYYISFDHDMMSSLFARYEIADADIKRAISHVISEIHFKDFMKPQEPEATLSIDCLKELLAKIDLHCEHETDSFARIIDQEVSKTISARILDLEAKLQEYQQKAQDSD